MIVGSAYRNDDMFLMGILILLSSVSILSMSLFCLMDIIMSSCGLEEDPPPPAPAACGDDAVITSIRTAMTMRQEANSYLE